MMKQLFLLPSLLLSSFVSAQSNAVRVSDLANDNVKGNVAHITQKYYQVLPDKNGKDSIGQQWEMTDRNYQMHFNAAGYIEWATYYKISMQLDYRYVYKYDAAGNRIQETWFDGENALDYRITRKFSAKGFLEEMKKYTDTTGECDERTTYEYDPNGHITKSTMYDGNDAMLGYTTYKYDEYGNAIEEDNFDSKNKPTGKILRTFDGNKHHVINEDAYNADGTIATKKKMQYEYRGHLSQQSNFDNNGKLVEKNIFTYNDNADQGQWTNFDRTGFVMYDYTYTYEYDAKGNWTKQYAQKAGKTVFVTVREISYN